MPADAGRLRNGPLQEIFWTRTGLLLLALLLISGASMVLASTMEAGAGKDFVNAVGSGTLITAVVGFGQTLITATAARRALVTPVVEESRRALRELSEEYRSLNKEFFPTDVFEASSEPNPAFNKLMMRDLRDTKQYFFRGFSGRHAAARLLLSHAEREVRVIIADPRDNTTVGGRTRYLLRHEGAEADFDAIQKRLDDEIWMGVVGLYLARSRCTRVDITVLADPPLDRLELFDASAWITLYSNAAEASTLYPRTLRFSEGSFIYGMERTEFLRLCNSRTERHFQLTPNTTESDFLALFEQITGWRPTERELQELTTAFHAFLQEFSIAAEIGS
ncbi:hypothetical protein [Amycolatopsis aidingensis]|uniref:hypothetical protein n=1 Tax=Amycolatopsis aidingensis TaxID=2842453 RepID=UPI001C0B1F29|nr:hypothetical protein [Amycolatopsis aidingensis]